MTHQRVYVWQINIEVFEENADAFFSLLSSDEQSRAAHLSFARDKRSFIVRRALLRMILGSYCSVHPHQLRFRQQQSGKPFIAFPGHTGIHFSHAHSVNMGLYAFSPDQAVGIDVEKIRSLPDLLVVARRFFFLQGICNSQRTFHSEQRECVFQDVEYEGGSDQGKRMEP